MMSLRSLPSELREEMTRLRQGQARYSNPFFAPELIPILSEAREDLRLYYETNDQGLSWYFPLHVDRSGVARGLGAAFSDRNGPVLAPNAQFDLQAFLKTNGLRKFVTEGLVLPGQGTHSGLSSAHDNLSHVGHDAASFLENQRATYPSFFKRLRRLERKLGREQGELRYTFDDQDEAALDWLIRTKREQYIRSRHHDVLRPEWSHQIIRLLWRCSSDSLRLRLSTLRVGDTLVAGELNLQSDQYLHGWIVAFDRDYAKYSPGNLLIRFVLSSLPDHGLNTYSSGVGGEHYKKYFTNAQEPLGQGVLRPKQTGLSLSKATQSLWFYAETHGAKPISHTLQRIRRRSEKICATEIGVWPRLRGHIGALQVEI